MLACMTVLLALLLLFLVCMNKCLVPHHLCFLTLHPAFCCLLRSLSFTFALYFYQTSMLVSQLGFYFFTSLKLFFSLDLLASTCIFSILNNSYNLKVTLLNSLSNPTLTWSNQMINLETSLKNVRFFPWVISILTQLNSYRGALHYSSVAFPIEFKW